MSLFNSALSIDVSSVFFRAFCSLAVSEAQSQSIIKYMTYIFNNSPDIIILNETWQKLTVLSSEILPCQYNVFRLDRSQNTHSIDPLIPSKFRKNGGGVLIAVHNELSIQSKVIPIKCAAKVLAVELTLCDGSKIILTTCYRVGTLGMPNCNIC